MPGVDFLDITVQQAQVLLLQGEIFLTVSGDQHHQDDPDDRSGDCRQRHRDIGQEHHHQTAEEHHQLRHHLADRAVECLGDRVHIIGHAGEGIPDGILMEVRHRQAVDLVRNVIAHGFRDELRDRRHDPLLQEGKDPTGRIEADQNDPHAGNGFHVDHPAEQPVFDIFRDLGKFGRTEQVQNGARKGKYDRGRKRGHVFFAVNDELFPGADQVLGFFTHAHAASRSAASSARAGIDIPDFVFFSFHYASSFSESCENAIC